MEKKKYMLRQHFSIEMGGEVVLGPKEIEIDQKTAEENKHKIEEIAPPKSKAKAEK